MMHMPQQRPAKWWTIGILALLCLLAPVWVAADQGLDAEGEGEGIADAEQLAQLAHAGRFDEILVQLKGDGAGEPRADVESLVADLERYQQHVSEHRQKRAEAYDKALAKIATAVDAGLIDDALIASIEAHSLSEDPADLLSHPSVQQAIAQAEQKAQTASEQGDWVQALSLYRELDLLFDDYSTYHEQVKRVSRHVRVLQLYAPEQLRKLYEAQLERRRASKALDDVAGEEGLEEEDKPLLLEPESWESRLKGVELPMLRQTLSQAVRDHVDSDRSGNYGPLLLGAVDALRIMLDTDGLTATFPQLADTEKLNQLRDYLTIVSAGLKTPEKKVEFLEMASTLERIMGMNKKTVGLPEAVVVYELAEGATGMLDDFSAVIWPQEKEQFSRSTQGKFFGVGIQISRRDGRLIVVSPLANTPAQNAGVKAGDIIAHVNNQDTTNWSLDRAVREITGPEGTQVTLGIERVGQKGVLEFEIRRAEIIIESIRGWQHTEGGEWDYWIDRNNRIGYVRLSQFIPQTVDDLDKAVAQMQDDGPINGLILDLRFNPGGLLSSAIDVSDRFIDEGPIVSTATADGRVTTETRAKRPRTYPPFPVAVLINQGSASASEIVSGALQDYRRAIVIGTRSFGKGSVQDLFPLDQGKAFLKLTTQYYMLPGGSIIHRLPEARDWGIEPDLTVEMTNEQIADSIELRQQVDVIRDSDAPADAEPQAHAEDILADGLDPQLEAAALVLKTQLVARHIAIARAAEPALIP
jgi:carboxyl-terminal processing protease